MPLFKFEITFDSQFLIIETFSFLVMENRQTKPRKFPLILILIGTTILAIPAAFGTAVLLDFSATNSVNVEDASGKFLFCLSLAGFALFAGYILTAIFRRHNCVFWLCSGLYNFALLGCYSYFLLAEAQLSPDFFGKALLGVLENPLSFFSFLLLPLWLIFVTVSSAYYFKFALRAKKIELP